MRLTQDAQVMPSMPRDSSMGAVVLVPMVIGGRGSRVSSSDTHREYITGGIGRARTDRDRGPGPGARRCVRPTSAGDRPHREHAHDDAHHRVVAQLQADLALAHELADEPRLPRRQARPRWCRPAWRTGLTSSGWPFSSNRRRSSCMGTYGRDLMKRRSCACVQRPPSSPFGAGAGPRASGAAGAVGAAGASGAVAGSAMSSSPPASPPGAASSRRPAGGGRPGGGMLIWATRRSGSPRVGG